jgi:hypothetical protein
LSGVQPTKIGQCGGAVLVGAVVVGAVLVGAVLVGAVVVGAVVCPTSAVADKQKVPIASRFLMVTSSCSIFFQINTNAFSKIVRRESDSLP